MYTQVYFCITASKNVKFIHVYIYTFTPIHMKKGIHPEYFKDVEVNCICWASFTINTTVRGPIKVESCHKCHPTYNKDKVIKKVIKWRMEKYLEKQKKMDAIKK